jgi:hypothetical protein
MLVRETDVTGVSGTGAVADGVRWPDGSVTVRWRGEWPTVQHHDRGQDSVDHIHGHGGATRVVWLDPDVLDADLTEARRLAENAAMAEAENCDDAQLLADYRAANKHMLPVIYEAARLRAALHATHTTTRGGIEWRRESITFLRDRDIPSPDGPERDSLHRWRVHLGGTNEACAWRLEREGRVGWPSIRCAPSGLQVHVREVDTPCDCAESGAIAAATVWCRTCGKVSPAGTPHDNCGAEMTP